MLKERILSILLTLALLLPAAAAAPAPEEGLRGVWIPSIYNLDYPTRQGMTEAELKSQANEILDNVKAMGLNAVFLQVRPAADALYESDIFPWSRYVSGTQGQAPAGGFDPLAYWVDAAHQRGLQLHAWLNPYRITRGGESDCTSLASDNPAKLHPEWVVKYEDNYYFNPGLSSVRAMVVDGACEIAENYDVDGIHLDDYFYPGTDFSDQETYTRYGKGFDSIDDWRRDNVNQLVADLDKALHDVDPDLSFGISPAGIWNNKSADPRGSDTAGRSSYAEIYCDTLAWIEAGTVDYVCPQIYWEIGFKIADFSKLVDWWTDAVKGSDVDLYVGVGAYRMEDATAGSVWSGTDELTRQLNLIAKDSGVSGEIFYRYNSLTQVAGASDVLSTHYAASPSRPEAQTPSPEQQADGLIETFSRFILALFH
ncbi:glycoside hydrolase family 10 protein [Butyricicoccus sp. Marseille-Q5471]|uniref:glycoside hydrolase family 10 protein n=1 Tax=Butyricicoccus sp. Marseille-Q5471 TaxID=3039493 RepID=UPI0024BBEDC3|nr:family 10 glycosylhydrolase [Butyricicoccus sp. Marseille-Q5471]